MDKQKIYKPTLISENALDIPNPGYAGKMPDGTQDGFISTKIEEDVTIQRISHDLYKHASSGFRELFVNEARFCRHARDCHDADPVINVKIGKNRELIIEGRDSMGMSWETFSNVYTVLGRSTNFDGQTPGQFGFGRAAYTCLSEIMIMEVHSRETGEKFAVMGKNGVGWQTGLPTPEDMDFFGCRITMTLYDDVDIRSIIRMMKNCCKLSGVRATLDIRDALDITGFSIHEHERKYLTYKPGTLEGMYYASTYCDDGEHLLNISAEEGGIEMMIGYKTKERSEGRGPKRRSVSSYIENNECYLAGVPIDELKIDSNVHSLLGSANTILVNIKDERTYSPTPDRERLKDDAEKRICDIVENAIGCEIRDRFSGIKTVNDYVNHPDRKFIDGICNNELNFRSILTENLMELGRVLAVTLVDENKRHINLEDIAPGRKELLITDKMSRSKISAAKEFSPAVKVVRPLDYENTRSLFENLGVRTLDDYIASNGITVKMIESDDAVRPFVIHETSHSDADIGCGSEQFRKTTTNTTDCDMPDNVIIANKNFGMLCDLLRTFDTKYRVTKYRKTAKGGLREEEFLERVRKSTYATNDGPMGIDDISETDKKIVMVPYDRESLAKYIPSEEILYVVGTYDKLFEVSAHLNVNGRKFHVSIIRCGYGLRSESTMFPEKHIKLMEECLVYDTEWRDQIKICLAYIDGHHTIKNDNIKKMFLGFVSGSKHNYNIRYPDVSQMLERALCIDEELQNQTKENGTHVTGNT